MKSSNNSEAIEKFIHRQAAARAKKDEKKVYEDYLRKGGSACQDSYSWKAHKSKYVPLFYYVESINLRRVKRKWLEKQTKC